ncbi:hypothetical protein V8C42DRAFT_110658 [Trichoderma barbatum]
MTSSIPHGLRRRRGTEWSDTPVGCASHRPQSETKCLLAAARGKTSHDFRCLRSHPNSVVSRKYWHSSLVCTGMLRTSPASRNKLAHQPPRHRDPSQKGRKKNFPFASQKRPRFYASTRPSDWTSLAFPRQCRPMCTFRSHKVEGQALGKAARRMQRSPGLGVLCALWITPPCLDRRMFDEARAAASGERTKRHHGQIWRFFTGLKERL